MPLPKIVKTRAFFFSAVLHVGIIVFLVIGIEPSHKLAPMHPNKPLMQAKAVNLAAIEADKKRKADALALAQKAALEKQLAEEKERKDVEEKKQQQAQRIEREKLAQEKKDKENKEQEIQALRAKQEAKQIEIAKRKAEKEKALAEIKRQEEVQRKQQADALEAKKKAQEKARQEKAKEEKARQKALDDALAEEEREMAQAQQRAADESELAKHIRSIAARVSAAFSYPPGLEKGLSCTLYVRMIPGGEVIEARVTKSSGSPTFDRQAENAVRKASPLPVPGEPRLFSRMREIQFTFDPGN